MLNFKKLFTITTLLSFPYSTFAQDNYVGLTDIGEFAGKLAPSVNFPTSFNALIVQAFYVSLAVVIVLALFGIIRGGYVYMTSADSASNKESGKKILQAAIGGLALGLGGYLILNTINPDILEFNPQYEKLDKPEVVPIKNLVAYDAPLDTNKDGVLSSEEVQAWVKNDPDLGSFYKEGGSTADAILAAAQYAEANPLTNNQCSATNNGRRACAYAVNEIVRIGTGAPIDSSLSTVTLNESLSESSRFIFVGNDLSKSQPGDIVVSPTSGDNTGHTGIVKTAGAGSILSNSSSGSEKSNGSLIVSDHYNAEKWKNSYGDLGINIYRAK